MCPQGKHPGYCYSGSLESRPGYPTQTLCGNARVVPQDSWPSHTSHNMSLVVGEMLHVQCLTKKPWPGSRKREKPSELMRGCPGSQGACIACSGHRSKLLRVRAHRLSRGVDGRGKGRDYVDWSSAKMESGTAHHGSCDATGWGLGVRALRRQRTLNLVI